MKIILSLTFVLILNFVPQSARAQTLNIAAVVNEEVISVLDLQSRISWNIISSNTRDTPEIRRRFMKKVLDRLINEKLKLQEAKRLGIKTTRAEINKHVKFMEKKSNLPIGTFYNIVRKAGLSNDVLDSQFNAEISWNKVVIRVFKSRVKVSEEEIQEIALQIEQNKGKPEHHIMEIFLPVDNPEKDLQVSKQAKSIAQQLQQGASFQVLAKNFSKSPSASKGGDIGWLRAGQLDPRLDAVIENMRPGQISNPIRTQAGFYVLLLHSQRRPKEESSNIDPVVSLLQFYLPFPSNPSEKVVAEKTKIVLNAKAQSNSCQNLEKFGKTVGSISLNIPKVKLSSIAPDLISLVSKLNTGESTELIKKPNGITIYMLCEKSSEQKKLPKVSIKNKIEFQLLNQRLSRMAQRYVRDLRRAAFIDIRL